MAEAGSEAQARIGSEWAGDVLVLQPAGRIDSNNAAAAEETILGHVSAGAQQLVLDLSDLEYISSAGLRVLLLTAKKLKQTGGKVILCNLHQNVHEVLEVSGFLAILPVCDGRDAAVATLRAA